MKTEEDPLDPLAGTPPEPACERSATSRTRSSGPAARCCATAALYGPGATDDQVELVRKRQFPLVGGGTGYTSWVHLDDAASATVLAVEQKATGVFNIVDDEPAPGERVAALPRGVRRREAAAARARRGWPGCWPARWRWR